MVEDLELTDEERMDMSLVAWLRGYLEDMIRRYKNNLFVCSSVYY